jgi:hypothetical protein
MVLKTLFEIKCEFQNALTDLIFQDSILAVPTISKLIALHDNYEPVS